MSSNEPIVARDVMARKVFSVGADLTLLDLERELAARRISGAPVVERGRVAGIVSRSDVDRFVSRERSASAATATFYLQTDPPEGPEFAPPPDPTRSALEVLQKTRVREIMTREVISVEPSTPVAEIARLMHARHIHRVLVLEDDALVGLVSSLDLVSVMARAAEPLG